MIRYAPAWKSDTDVPEFSTMRRNLTFLIAVAAMLSVATGWSFLQEATTGVSITQNAKAFVAALSNAPAAACWFGVMISGRACRSST